jgi:hypothetical protein
MACGLPVAEKSAQGTERKWVRWKTSAFCRKLTANEGKSMECVSGAAADKHRGYYHIGTVSVKENFEMTQGKGDIVWHREERKTRKRA